jgi:hypothetical protein
MCNSWLWFYLRFNTLITFLFYLFLSMQYIVYAFLCTKSLGRFIRLKSFIFFIYFYTQSIEMIFIVGEQVFPDTAQMIAQRNAAAQAAARQNTSILNVEAAKAEAKRRVDAGRFVTVPTSINPNTIVRSNTIGYNGPSVSAMRSLTPNGPTQQAMSAGMQMNNSSFMQPVLSGNLNQGANAQLNANAIAQSQATQASNNALVANKVAMLGGKASLNSGITSSGKRIVL